MDFIVRIVEILIPVAVAVVSFNVTVSHKTVGVERGVAERDRTLLVTVNKTPVIVQRTVVKVVVGKEQQPRRTFAFVDIKTVLRRFVTELCRKIRKTERRN